MTTTADDIATGLATKIRQANLTPEERMLLDAALTRTEPSEEEVSGFYELTNVMVSSYVVRTSTMGIRGFDPQPEPPRPAP